jgi:hypothetical protein
MQSSRRITRFTDLVRIGAALFVLCAVMSHGSASAQTPGPLQFLPVRDGDCSLRIQIQPDTDIRDLAIAVDTIQITARRITRRGDTARVALREPVRENEIVSATLPPSASASTRVLQATERDGAPITTCITPTYKDDRGVFEASGYIGTAFDNFAPGETSYIAPQAAPGTHSQWLAGVEAQYRLVGNKGRTFQIWLGTFTLHGVRSGDVDCNLTPSATLCQNHPPIQDKFLAIIEHASSIEAYFDTRVEFWTFQKKSEMPIKAYALARFGFTDFTGSPKVANNDALGVGVMSPSGVFRNSTASVAWGRSEQFASDPGWNRLKVSGRLIFDVAPGFKDSLEFWKRLAGSPRAFVQINVDRHPGSGAADSVITYVGIDFDLRGMFFGFGG